MQPGCPESWVTANCPFYVDAPVLGTNVISSPLGFIGPPFIEGLISERVHLKFLPAEADKAFHIPTPCSLAAEPTGGPRDLMGSKAGVHPAGRESSPAVFWLGDLPGPYFHLLPTGGDVSTCLTGFGGAVSTHPGPTPCLDHPYPRDGPTPGLTITVPTVCLRTSGQRGQQPGHGEAAEVRGGPG